MTGTLEQITPQRLTGAEELPMGATVLDFWQWTGSDLMSNTLRGALGEYFVALTVGSADGVQEEWAPYDVKSPDGIKIEVKTSGLIQTWKQSELSTPDFGIGPSTAWDAATNLWSSEKKRWSDVYVFCLHHHQEQSSVNPLDLSQWTFYVLPTATLDRERPDQRTIRIAPLKQIGAVAVSFDGLGQAITAAYNVGKASANTNSNTGTEV